MICLRIFDTVRHSKTLRTLNALKLYLLATLRTRPISAARLASGLGFSENKILDRLIVKSLKRRFSPESNVELWSSIVANLPRYKELLISDPKLTRSIVLKAPGENGERGVLLMYFEYNWVRLALGTSKDEFEWLDKHFDFVFSTSWSPTDYAALAMLLAKCRGSIFVQACNHHEAQKLLNFHPRISVLETLPCDWINPAFYPSVNWDERDIDFLMVANWGAFKRHWEFFEALRSLPADLKIVLVGQIEGGRDENYIRRLADSIGVPQKLEIHQSIPIEVVAKLQSRSKVSLIFTRREGCCVAAVESLFAGCSLGMRTDAHIGPLAYINQETGLALRPSHLTEDLMRLLELSETQDPAQWARDHISCHQTHAKLNAQLRASCLERGLPWTQDIAKPHWRPYPVYANAADVETLKPCYSMLSQRFPSVFGNGVSPR